LSPVHIFTVSALSFLVSSLSIATGGTSLFTVPLLILMGMHSKTAVASNMFGLVFLSIGGFLGFHKYAEKIDNSFYLLILPLTVTGSIMGARLVLNMDPDVLRIVISLITIAVIIFFIFNRNAGLIYVEKRRSFLKLSAGFMLIFILGIYGGFYSGGYVIMLSFVLIGILGMTFLQSAYLTKIINIFSSTAAVAVFFKTGLIDFRVAVPLSVSMAAGGYLGARYTGKRGSEFIRKLFMLFMLAIALRLLFFD